MANSTNSIREYVRENWALADLRQIVEDTSDWDAGTAVHLTAPQDRSSRGTIEVRKAE